MSPADDSADDEPVRGELNIEACAARRGNGDEGSPVTAGEGGAIVDVVCRSSCAGVSEGTGCCLEGTAGASVEEAVGPRAGVLELTNWWAAAAGDAEISCNFECDSLVPLLFARNICSWQVKWKCQHERCKESYEAAVPFFDLWRQDRLFPFSNMTKTIAQKHHEEKMRFCAKTLGALVRMQMHWKAVFSEGGETQWESGKNKRPNP